MHSRCYAQVINEKFGFGQSQLLLNILIALHFNAEKSLLEPRKFNFDVLLNSLQYVALLPEYFEWHVQCLRWF